MGVTVPSIWRPESERPLAMNAIILRCNDSIIDIDAPIPLALLSLLLMSRDASDDLKDSVYGIDVHQILYYAVILNFMRHYAMPLEDDVPRAGFPLTLV